MHDKRCAAPSTYAESQIAGSLDASTVPCSEFRAKLAQAKADGTLDVMDGFDGGSMPSLVAPIFNAGANQANLDIAKIEKDIGIAQYEKAIQTAFREVSDGAARGTFDEQLAATQRWTDAERSRLQLEEMRYATGVDGYLGVLNAQTDLYSAQQALVSARLDRLASLVDLYRSLGGGWIQRTGDEPRPADEPVLAKAAASGAAQ